MTYFPLNVFDTRDGAVVDNTRPAKAIFTTPHLHPLWSQWNTVPHGTQPSCMCCLSGVTIATILVPAPANAGDGRDNDTGSCHMQIVRKPDSEHYTLTLNREECFTLHTLLSEVGCDHLGEYALNDLADFKRALGFVGGAV